MVWIAVGRACIAVCLVTLPVAGGSGARTVAGGSRAYAAASELRAVTPPGVVPPVAAPPVVPADTPAVGPPSITGEVWARGVGLSVPGAVVTVLGPGGRAEAHKRSDSRGDFVFRGLRTGTYTVRAAAPGFVRAVQAHVLVRSDQTVHVTLWLDPQPLTIPKLQVEARRRSEVFIQHQIGMDVHSLDPSDVVLGSRLQKRERSSSHFVDLLRTLGIPGLVVDRSPSGQGYCIQINGVVGDTGQPLCAEVYLDGLPVGDLSSLDNDLMDIGGVVLLHADQAGDLYGTGADGGVLLIYTREGMGMRPK